MSIPKEGGRGDSQKVVGMGRRGIKGNDGRGEFNYNIFAIL
jgi:hypothetical protein